MKHAFRLVLASCVVLMLGCCILGATTVPVLKSHINDYANKLGHTEENDLERTLSAFEQETSNQVVILVTQSLDGETIESYSQNVFHAWALGQKEKNNGVLLVWAPTERKVRIHVGYGLEGVLTDALASQIIRNEIIPRLKSGDSDAAIKSGVTKITQAIKGEYAVEQNSAPQAQVSGLSIFLFAVAVIVVLVAGALGGPVVGGIVGAVVGFLFGTWIDIVVLITVLGFLLGLISRFVFEVLDSGGSGGSSSWSSSSSDSSWGGGGGDSGGGGASGSY